MASIKKQDQLQDQDDNGIGDHHQDLNGPTSPAGQVNNNLFDSLNCMDKLEIFNLWNVVTTCGNACAITYSIRGLAEHVDIITELSMRICVGVACFTLWFTTIQYFEFNPRYYIMIFTLKTAVPRILQFVVGILPCFIGYALLGVILFGDRQDRFASLVDTTTTLFAVVNGDSIMTVINTVNYMPVIGELYICFYTMLFTYVCLMTCMAIVEDSFFSSAEHAHKIFELSYPLLGPAPVQQATPDDEEMNNTWDAVTSGNMGVRRDNSGLYSSMDALPPPSLEPTLSVDSVASGTDSAPSRRSARYLPPKIRAILDNSSSSSLAAMQHERPTTPQQQHQMYHGTLSASSSYNQLHSLSRGDSGIGGLEAKEQAPDPSSVDAAFKELQAVLLAQVSCFCHRLLAFKLHPNDHLRCVGMYCCHSYRHPSQVKAVGQQLRSGVLPVVPIC